MVGVGLKGQGGDPQAVGAARVRRPADRRGQERLWLCILQCRDRRRGQREQGQVERQRPQETRSRNSGHRAAFLPQPLTSLWPPSQAVQDLLETCLPAPAPSLKGRSSRDRAWQEPRAGWAGFPWCVRNQGALRGTSSAQNQFSVSCTPPLTRVLPKCLGCP